MHTAHLFVSLNALSNGSLGTWIRFIRDYLVAELVSSGYI